MDRAGAPDSGAPARALCSDMLRLRRPLLALALAGTPAALASQGRVAGTVHDSLATRGPLEGARVILDGLPTDAVTDRRGRFEFRDVPAGTYVISFFHPLLDSLRLSAPAYRFDVPARGRGDVALAVPGFARVSNYLCGAPQDTTTTLVLGRVRRAEDGAPLAGAEARAAWYEYSLGGGERLERVDRAVTARSDSAGEFVLCGVPNDIEVAVQVLAEGQESGPLDLTRRSAIVPMEVRVAARPGTGRLRVTVTDERGRPVANAVAGVRGTERSSTTDGRGVAVIDSVPVGSRTIAVRSIGRAPATRLVAVAPAGETGVAVVLSQVAALLPEVRVRGVRADPTIAGFERRRRAGNGYFLGPAELAKRGSGTAALATIPGIHMPMGLYGGYPLPYFRLPGGGTCIPSIVVDGMQWSRMSGWELNSLLQSAHRVEAYPRALLIPTEFPVGRACGALVIWTQ